MALNKPRKAAASSSATSATPPARANRKRRLSSVSNNAPESHEEETSSIASPAARKRQRNDNNTAKRRMGLRAAAIEADTAKQEDDGGTETGHETPERHVHFDTGASINTVDELGSAVVRMPVKRRKTSSPYDGLHKERLRVAVARASLPNRPDAPVESAGILYEPIRYTPLREMIDQRKQSKRGQVSRQQDETDISDGSRAASEEDTARYWIQMAKDEERIRTLLAEVASGRHDDDTLNTMTDELHALQQNLAKITALDTSGKSTDDLLIADIRRASTSQALDPLQASPMAEDEDMYEDQDEDENSYSFSTRHWDTERTKLQDAVLALSQQVNDIKERWRIHEIALQSLGFSSEEATGDETIALIRDAFDGLRAGVSLAYPSNNISQASNAEIVEVAISMLDTLSVDSSLLTSQLADRNKLASELRTQINGLVERIADAETDLERVRKQRTVLLKQAEVYDIDSRKSASEIQRLCRDRNVIEKQLATTNDELDQARSNTDQLTLTVQRYKTSLHGYRKEEERLSLLIGRMEEEHAKALDELNGRLNAESTAYSTAKEELGHAQAEIIQLETEVSTVSKERDSVLNKLQTLDGELQAEQRRREQVEASVQVRGSETDQLQDHIEHLEEELSKVEEKVLTLEAQCLDEEEKHLAVHSQLLEVRETNVKLETRQSQIGIENNELRMKLHETLRDRDEAAIHLEQLEVALQTLRETLKSQEQLNLTMRESAQHASSQADAAIRSRDVDIESYKSTIASYEAQIIDLEAEKASLEQRVEGEAEQMLQTQAEKLDELDELRDALVNKQNKILVVESKARETDRRWQDLLHDRENELEHTQAVCEQQQLTIASLSLELQDQRDRFADYILVTQNRMREISGAFAAAETIVQGECAAADAAGEIELEALGLARATSKSRDVSTNKNGKVIRRRNHDSGIGIASDGSDVDHIAA